MSFQTQLLPMRSTFQGAPVRMPATHAQRVPWAQVQVQALGAQESVPVIVEAMKIGFMYGAIPGAIKGAWDVKRAMAEPHAGKPLTPANKQVMVSNQAALYGASGALIGLCTGVLSTQFNLSPDAAWQAGTASGLCLYAIMVGASKQLLPNATNTDASVQKTPDLCDEEQCELPENWDEEPCDDAEDSI